MFRFVLILILIVFVARAFWRIVDGMLEGLSGSRGRTQVPPRGVQMVRDPVCGTFVVPDRALMLSVGRQQFYFCSTACRDKYRTQHKSAS
jgi:YHS domain-containing protein